MATLQPPPNRSHGQGHPKNAGFVPIRSLGALDLCSCVLLCHVAPMDAASQNRSIASHPSILLGVVWTGAAGSTLQQRAQGTKKLVLLSGIPTG